MKFISAACILLILAAVIVVPASAANPNQYSYISINSVNIDLGADKAVYDVEYKVDDVISLLVVFLGNNDLKEKLIKILGLSKENYRIESASMDNARIILLNPSLDNGDGSLWFPKKDMLVYVPEVTINTPRFSRNYENINVLQGLGYFGDDYPEANELESVRVKMPELDLDKMSISESTNVHYF